MHMCIHKAGDDVAIYFVILTANISYNSICYNYRTLKYLTSLCINNIPSNYLHAILFIY